MVALTGKDMMDLLRHASPSFEPCYHEFELEWEEESEKPYYLALSAYADHIISLLANEDKESLTRVYAAMERLLDEGDEYVKKAVLWGLIEDLQDYMILENMEFGRVEREIGQLTKTAWLCSIEYRAKNAGH